MQKKLNLIRFDGNLAWIKLTQGKETCIDKKNYELVKNFGWSARKCRNTFYAIARIRGTKDVVQLHQLLLPGSKIIDHKNRNGLDNRRKNLRRASFSQNQRNRQKSKNNLSGFKGVGIHSGIFRARITLNRTSHYLGHFVNPIEAAHAYDAAARRLHGSFAHLNFP